MNHALFPGITMPEGSIQTVYTTRPNHFHPHFQGNPRKLYTCEYQDNSRTDLSKRSVVTDPPDTLALKGLPTMCWGPPYLMEIR